MDETLAFEDHAMHDDTSDDHQSGGGDSGQNDAGQNKQRRRALHFWAPFNSWWRVEHDRLNRRPTTIEIEAWYNEKAQETWGDNGDMPSLDETRVHAKCLRTVAAVREYFAGYRKSKSLAKAGVTGMTHKRRATGSSAHEFDIGAEGIGGLDFQLGSMLQMGGLSAGGAMVLPDGFDLDLMMGNGSTMPHFNLVQPQPPMPGLLMSQIHHTAALTQQNTLDAITHQLNVLKNAKPALLSADSAMEDMKPHERAKVNVAALSREELEERVVFLEEQLERKERESLELEEALAKATNTSTVDLREAVSALKSMNAVR